MTLTRVDLQWLLLTEQYSGYCVPKHQRNSSASLLRNIQPEDQTRFPLYEKAKAYHDQLLAMNDSELRVEIEQHFARKEAEKEAAHLFNQPDALANSETYEFWSRAEIWSLPEAAVLINARNPAAINEEALGNDRTSSNISKKLQDTLQLLERARTAHTLHRLNSPKRLIDWLDLKDIRLPNQLRELILQRNGGFKSVEEETEKLQTQIPALQSNSGQNENTSATQSLDKPLGLRERESLLKLALGMAMKGYRFDPKATRSTQVQEIADDLIEVGLSLDVDTVRKYLNEAKLLLPEQEAEEK